MKHLGWISAALLVAACGKDDARAPAVRTPDARAAAPTPAPVIDATLASAPDASAVNKITISLAPAGPDTPGLAARCSLEGDPLGSECRLSGGNLAVDGDGRVYVVETAGGRRSLPAGAGAGAAAEGGCALALDRSFGTGGVLAFPAMTAPGQVVGKGPLYMRSGGPAWSLAVGPRGVVHAYDYLLGIHRVDRGKVEPVCPGLQGVDGLVWVGGQAVIARGGAERLTLGKKCKTRPFALEPRPTFGLFAVHGVLAGETDAKRIALYDPAGAASAQLGDDDAHAAAGFCSAMAVVACGDAVCVVDHNCKKVPRYGLDGAHQRTYAFDALFTDSPYVVSTAVTGPDGATWFSAAHKDGAACEGAIYRLAPDAWP